MINNSDFADDIISSNIIGFLKKGATFEDISKVFPFLTEEDLKKYKYQSGENSNEKFDQKPNTQ